MMELTSSHFLLLFLVFYFHGDVVSANCFQHDCNQYNTFEDCLLDTHNHFHCHHNEMCEVRVDVHGLHMECRPIDGCHHEHDHNTCGNPPDPSTEREPCVYCCQDAACVLQVAQNTAQLQWIPRPAPGSCYTTPCHHQDSLASCSAGTYACLGNEYCDLHINNGALVTGCFNYQDHKYHDCLARQAANRDHCSNTFLHPAHHDCRFCCADDACVKNMMTSLAGVGTTAPTTTLMTTTAAPAVAQDDLHPGKNNCYTTNCDHHAQFPQCSAGQWACHHSEFCKVGVAHNGDLHMHCANRDHEWQKCVDDSVHHNHPECQDPSTFTNGGPDCHFCCLDSHCVHYYLQGPPTTNATTSPPTTTTVTPTRSTISQSTAQSSVCVDKYTGDCQTDFGHLCSDLNVQTLLCTKTCGACPTTTTLPPTTTTTLPPTTTPICLDNYNGDCQKDFGHLCSDHSVQTILCAKTCGACPSGAAVAAGASAITPTPTTAAPPATTHGIPITTATTTAGSCVDTFLGDCSTTFANMCHVPEIKVVCRATCKACHEHTAAACVDEHQGNCSVDFAPAMCQSSQVVATVCRKTCGLCSNSGGAVTGSSATTRSATYNPVTPAQTGSSATTRSVTYNPVTHAQAGKCVQCGDVAGGTPCSDWEMLSGQVTDCPDSNAPLCMTDVMVDSYGDTSVYKRCVDSHTCLNLWYLQTSDKRTCMAFDPSSPNPDITCHYCCQGDGCNSDFVPAHNKLWTP